MLMKKTGNASNCNDLKETQAVSPEASRASCFRGTKQKGIKNHKKIQELAKLTQNPPIAQ